MLAGTSWSSSTSCTSSFGSLDDDAIVCGVLKTDDDVGAATAAAEGSVKFLCSHGGRILPRHTDGALRYVGGDNRVLSVDRPLQFHELQRKLRELCGWDEVCLRCQLPTEDLDALISVTSDDDLANLLEEYDVASKDRLQPLKIRAFLFPRPPPPSNGHLRRQNTSRPAAAARVSPSPTCAPRQWARGAAPAHLPPGARAHRPRRYDDWHDGPGEARLQLWYHLVHSSSHWQ